MLKRKKPKNHKKLIKPVVLGSILSLVVILFVFLADVKKTESQAQTLVISNVNVATLSSTSVTIAWETNLISDSQIHYGKTSSYELTASCGSCYSSSEVLNHIITIGSLDPGTTYHFQVESKTSTASKKSLDRTFVTPSGAGDTDPPLVTFIGIDTSDVDAIITISTSEETHVTFYYDTVSRGKITDYNDSIGNIAGDPYEISHTFNIFGLTALTKYYYRVQAKDIANNTSTTAEFSFTTTDGKDRIFTTGSCAGGVPLGGCSGDGKYCDPGSGALVDNCTKCGYSCPAGQTCQPGGVCSTDPALTGDPSQCNSSQCYQNCTDDATLYCFTDDDCAVAGAGTCVDDRIFNSPAPPGCYATYPSCDANVILKVRKDRICDKWLTCGTGVEQTDPKTGEINEFCLNLSACTSLGEGGQCNNAVDLNKQELTFRTPDEIDEIRWLTGAVTAGLDWQYLPGSPIIKGYYPWSTMSEVGGNLNIQNSTFEETRVDAGAKTYDISLWEKWKPFPDPISTNPTIQTTWDPVSGKDKRENRVLKVEEIIDLDQGVSVELDERTSAGSDYIISIRIKSDSSDTQFVTLELSTGGVSPTTSFFGQYELSTGWKEILTDPKPGIGGEATFLNVYVSNGGLQPFYIDDVFIKPALEVRSETYLKRSCRMYPKEDSPFCEYYDDNGLYNKGWYGYCLMRDPENKNICISWWPVDILFGESDVFGMEEDAGYLGREPLYYCLESRGKYNYFDDTHDDRIWCMEAPGGPGGESCTKWPPAGLAYDFNLCDSEGACDFDMPARTSFIDGRLWAYKAFAAGDSRNALRESEISSVLIDKVYDWGNTRPNDFYFYGAEMKGNFSRDAGTSGRLANYTIRRRLRSNLILWEFYPKNSSASPDLMWFALLFQCKDINDNDINCTIDMDAQTYGYATIGVDNTGDPNDAESASFQIKIRKHEACEKIVQVVKSGGQEMAWADRVDSKGFQVYDLNYKWNTDLSPYGGAVTGFGDPTQWNTPLYAEEPNSTDFDPPEYQLRAGKAYACTGDCKGRICIGGGAKDKQNCQTHQDCFDKDSSKQGVCTGVGTCSETKNICFVDTDCAGDENVCVGGAATNRGPQSATKVILDITDFFGHGQCSTTVKSCLDDRDCPGAEYCVNQKFADRRIRELFARSYGIWKWDPENRKYVEWSYSKKALYNDEDLPLWRWGPPDIACPNRVRPRFDPDAGDPMNNDYCGIAPIIRNIKLGDGSSNTVKLGQSGGKVSLSFNIKVDRQQQPLKNIFIDWGDDKNDQGVESIAFGFKSRDDPEAPHVYTHNYDPRSCGKDRKCIVRIAVEDNWQWCNTDQATTWAYGICEGGTMAGQHCPVGRGDIFYCGGFGICVEYPCRAHPKSTWAPVDTCIGGSCDNGFCVAGQDEGRMCGDLIVDLNS